MTGTVTPIKPYCVFDEDTSGTPLDRTKPAMDEVVRELCAALNIPSSAIVTQSHFMQALTGACESCCKSGDAVADALWTLHLLAKFMLALSDESDNRLATLAMRKGMQKIINGERVGFQEGEQLRRLYRQLGLPVQESEGAQ